MTVLKTIGTMLIYFTSAAVLVLLIAFVFQYFANKYNKYKYPPFGKRVKVNGKFMHYNYTGIHNKGPLVILESGAGCSSLEWSLIQPEISKFARVLSYDRAGLGWSQPNSKPKSLENMAKDLHSLLQKANLEGPYIMVGHSMGGLILNKFADKYPRADIKGVVLVDSASENFLDKFPNITEISQYDKLKIKFKFYSGYYRIHDFFFPPDLSAYQKFDSQIRNIYISHRYDHDILGGFEESCQLAPITAEAKTVSNALVARSMPVTVISSEIATSALDKDSPINEISRELQDEFKSRYGNQTIAKGSDHFITRNCPEIIVEAVKNLVGK